MPLSEAEFALAVETISETAFNAAAWDRALVLLAKAGGGNFGQVLGVHPVFGFQFNIISEMPPEIANEFVVRGGNDPRINPRARTFARPDYSVHTDRMLASREELAKSEFMQDLCYKMIDSAELRTSRLPAINGIMLCACISRSRIQPEFDVAGNADFAALLPHIHRAIHMRYMLDQQGAALAAGALDAVSATAFVVDSAQTVVSLTREAESLLRKGEFLSTRQRRLEAVTSESNASLQAALRVACSRPPPLQHAGITTVQLRSESGAIVNADISALPTSGYDLRFGPVAIVAIERQRPRPNTSSLLRQMFDLTQAEAGILEMLLQGRNTAEIAGRRCSSVETVRTQIKAVLRKVGVGSRAELMRKLASFIEPL